MNWKIDQLVFKQLNKHLIDWSAEHLIDETN